MLGGCTLDEALEPRHRRALLDAISTLVDDGFDTVAALLDGEPLADQMLADALPPQYAARYTPVFVKQFVTCIIIVGWKLTAPQPTPLACVAEELALSAIIERAAVLSDVDGISADFGEFEEIVFDDTDFKQLWNPRLDGLSGSDLGRRLGMASLDFKDWFTPFRPDTPVHPYVEEQEAESGGP